MPRVDPRLLADSEAVEKALEEVGLRSPAAPRLHLRRAWPIRGGGLCLVYTQADGDIASAWSLVTAHHGLPPSVRKALSSGSPTLVPGLRSFAFPFPDDPRLKYLSTLGKPSRMRRELAEHLSTESSPRIRYRSYKPLYRSMIEYRFGKRPLEALFLKAQTRYGYNSTRKVYRALETSAGAADLGIPLPLAYLAKRHAIVWPAVEGTSLRSLLRRGDDGLIDCAGHALAQLHKLPISLERRHDRARELETVAVWVQAAAGVYSQWRGDLLEIQDSLERITSVLPAPRLRPAHRDFHDEQLLVHGDRVRVLDLDTAAMAEPELDVANFLAHLALNAEIDQSRTDDVARFLIAYQDEAAEVIDQRLVDWYRGSALLRLGCVYSFRAGGDKRVPRLLEEATAALNNFGTSREMTL